MSADRNIVKKEKNCPSILPCLSQQWHISLRRERERERMKENEREREREIKRERDKEREIKRERAVLQPVTLQSQILTVQKFLALFLSQKSLIPALFCPLPLSSPSLFSVSSKG